MTIGSMLEGVVVEVLYCHYLSRFTYCVRWRGLDGRLCSDRKIITSESLDFFVEHPGCVVMMTPIFTQEHGHIAAMVYLIATDDKVLVARMQRVPMHGPDEEFYLPHEPVVEGPGIHPVPVRELRDVDECYCTWHHQRRSTRLEAG